MSLGGALVVEGGIKMNRDTKLATYWTVGSIAVLVLVALIAWWFGVFETAAK